MIKHINFLKHTCLALLAVVLLAALFMPILNVSATNEQTSPDGTISEKEHDQIFCQNASAAALFTAKCAGETPNLSGGTVNGRTITITMHSGPAAHEDYGHFEDGDHDEDNIYQHTGEFFGLLLCSASCKNRSPHLLRPYGIRRRLFAVLSADRQNGT